VIWIIATSRSMAHSLNPVRRDATKSSARNDRA
jgi:hypothetical protein